MADLSGPDNAFGNQTAISRRFFGRVAQPDRRRDCPQLGACTHSFQNAYRPCGHLVEVRLARGPGTVKPRSDVQRSIWAAA